MSSGQKWRWGITAVLVILSFMAFWDTFKLWTMDDAERSALQESNPDKLLELQQNSIRLGLALQGGIHTVLRVKSEELEPALREGAVDRAMQVLRSRIDGLGVVEPIIQKQGEDRIIIDLPGYTDASRAEALIGKTALLEFKMMESFATAEQVLAKVDSVVHSMELAKSGMTETPRTPADTTSKSTDTASNSSDVLSEMMGDSSRDTSSFEFDDSAKVGAEEKPFSSRLEISMFNSKTGINWPGFIVGRNDKPILERWLALPEVQHVIPQGVEFAWSTRSSIVNNREAYELFVLKRKVEFLGRFIEGVKLGVGENGGFSVDFQLSGDNANRFGQLTGANIDKPLAIVMDDKVESAAFINSKIRNRGQITMGSSANVDEARNLEIVLKAGALPAPVEIIEKNVVGASLGADSIRKGFISSLLGLILVLAYIGAYYRMSGLIADIGLLFNVFFLLAILAGLGATLTMPGIAGIILTIGISVDSNILIFERIREEMRTGKTIRAAIDAGYDRAFTAILDSHVTTLITAGALFIFGSGPIKGFAITLFWGVTLSLFTAYVITKAIFDIRKGYKTLSI